MDKFKKLYRKEYFKKRNFNDKKRLTAFLQEKKFMSKHLNINGKVCDVGCSTGEFLETINWKGPRFGMEISDHARGIAKKYKIDFTKNILTEKNFFDTVVFRGTIQHIPTPFYYISKSFEALKPGGYLVFLATPNANSIVYKLKNHLHVLDPIYNFYIPSDKTLVNSCINHGFKFLDIEKPYLDSPYSNYISDHLKFIQMCIGLRKPDFSFWGNLMNLIFYKPKIN